LISDFAHGDKPCRSSRSGRAVPRRHAVGDPEQRGARGWLGVELSERLSPFTPGPFEAVKLSVVAQHRIIRIDFRTPGWPSPRETSVRQLRARSASRSSRASWQEGFITSVVDGDAERQSRHPQPDAGSVLDGGHILIHGARGHRTTRLCMQVKEKMLLAGFVVLMMLDGHGDLQRPHAHQ
jgi:hypothetical protein